MQVTSSGLQTKGKNRHGWWIEPETTEHSGLRIPERALVTQSRRLVESRRLVDGYFAFAETLAGDVEARLAEEFGCLDFFGAHLCPLFT